MNKSSKIITMLLIVTLAISSYFLIKKLVENKKENDIFEELQETFDNSPVTNENQNSEDFVNSEDNYYNLENIKNINSDVIGWIKIDETNINYPIMQNGDYYLHRNIYKKYSCHGTPYLAEYCDLNSSDNLIVYGHNMKDDTMFSALEKYKNYDFYLQHRYIKLYTLENEDTIENLYEIVSVFKTNVNSENSFEYYSYINFNNEDSLEEFINNCKNLELYSTGVEVNFGDKFVTLSTCEYSQDNGRMVVVAKKIK